MLKYKHISQVIETQGDMPIVGAITLYVSLLTFTLRVHPDRLDYVDQVLVCYVNSCSIYIILFTFLLWIFESRINQLCWCLLNRDHV